MATNIGMNDFWIEDLLQFDVDKYVNWLLTTSPADWQGLTKEERENFPYWRQMAYKEQIDFRNSMYVGSPLPLKLIQERETERIGNRLNKFYAFELEKLANGWVTDNYYEMACLVGLIDYLKHLYSPTSANTETSEEVVDNTAWLPDNEAARQVLFNALLDYGYIHGDSKNYDFFSLTGATKWKANNSALYYLIDHLFSRGFLKQSLSPNNVLSMHFRDKAGREFKPKSVNSSRSRTTSTKPRGADEIDNILARLPVAGCVKSVKV